MNDQNIDILLAELHALDEQGVSLWIEDERSTPDEVTEALCVRESHSYMRDYVFEGEALSELHFHCIDNGNTQNKKKRKNKFDKRNRRYPFR